MNGRDEQALIEWAHEYNGYDRVARSPERLGAVLEPLREEFQRTRVIPDWAGVDLLRAWAFWCARSHRHSGGYDPFTEEHPEVLAIVDALRRHPRATDSDRPRDFSPWPHDDFFHAWWVHPHRLLAGEYPGATSPEKAQAKLRLLVEAGIEVIIDLTTPQDNLAPYDEQLRVMAEQAGRTVHRHRHPIPDNSVIGHAGYDAILARIHTEINAGRTVYLHCWGGKGRTSTVVGCLLAESGLNYADIIARIAELRSGTRKAMSPCPETAQQRNLLRQRCTETGAPPPSTNSEG